MFLDVLSDFFVIPEEGDGSRDEDDCGESILPDTLIEATKDEADDEGDKEPDDLYDESEWQENDPDRERDHVLY